jgi:hypothetical protein
MSDAEYWALYQIAFSVGQILVLLSIAAVTIAQAVVFWTRRDRLLYVCCLFILVFFFLALLPITCTRLMTEILEFSRHALPAEAKP